MLSLREITLRSTQGQPQNLLAFHFRGY